MDTARVRWVKSGADRWLGQHKVSACKDECIGEWLQASLSTDESRATVTWLSRDGLE